MPAYQDGPSSSLFTPLPLTGNISLGALAAHAGISPEMAAAVKDAPSGECTGWGIPFRIGEVILLDEKPVEVSLPPVTACWLIFMHTSDHRPVEADPGAFGVSRQGRGRLNEHAATYLVRYTDGTEERAEIRRRHQIGAFHRGWGENCFEAVAQRRPMPERAAHEQLIEGWGRSQTRAASNDSQPWTNWLYAWQNPHPEKTIASLRCEPVSGIVVLAAVSAGQTTDLPLSWQTRRKAILYLPEGTLFQPTLDERGLLSQIQLDLGQVISTRPRTVYPDQVWDQTYNNQVPALLPNDILLEYTCHPEACFHLWDGRVIPVASVEVAQAELPLSPVASATQRVMIRIIEHSSGQMVAAKLHVHGEAGEYLAPVDRHRIINPAWYEDYSVDFINRRIHPCTYIPGEATLDLPLGRVYLEVSKGFEIRPVRKMLDITEATESVEVEVATILPWRDKGWVTADTHVHFLSPISALLEGAGEGVNVINLLASQWGELMTNVGDFDGKTTWGSREAGGDGEYLVRVGTENRQHILGHISLLGYNGKIIAPMTTGGPDESALGDPIEVLLTEWARQCKEQGGVVVLPHFPNPRAEHAASIVDGQIDAVEMTAWGNLYGGIDPYSLADWYRYLNCGYLVAAVGGTDKMSADTAVGTVRTYAHIPDSRPFTYPAWMDAIRRAETFVTYGPLIEFRVNGKPMGHRISLPEDGGTLDIEWQARSVTVPMTRVELVVSGEIRESVAADAWQAGGEWRLRVERSAWAALLVRGHYADQPEIITAHSSPVMLDVAGSQMLAAADAVTILDQIEGALAYLDTVGTRAEDAAYKRMRLVLDSSRRRLHNRMHEAGYFHDHTPLTDHKEHH